MAEQSLCLYTEKNPKTSFEVGQLLLEVRRKHWGGRENSDTSIASKFRAVSSYSISCPVSSLQRLGQVTFFPVQRICPTKQVFQHRSPSRRSESIQWSREYLTNFNLGKKKKKAWGENCNKYIANLVKLLGQLSAYQCLVLIYLYKTEVTDTSHEYLTHSSVSSAKDLPSPKIFWSFDSEPNPVLTFIFQACGRNLSRWLNQVGKRLCSIWCLPLPSLSGNGIFKTDDKFLPSPLSYSPTRMNKLHIPNTKIWHVVEQEIS